jgi:2-polyprenyl-6-methoxyphenol hydroxylase-like FAD-dependent oxidoreductase
MKNAIAGSNGTEENSQAALQRRPQADVFDVVIVDAGLAGGTAARLFALEGPRLVLVEQHRDLLAFKQLCAHVIQACARPTLRRLGFDRLMEEAGGVRNGVDIWTRYGWTGDLPPLDATGKPVFGYDIQRRTLDPHVPAHHGTCRPR